MHDRALRSVRRSRNSRLSHGVISRLRGVAVGFNAQSKPLAGASEAGPWARIIRVIKEGGDGKVKQVAADKVIIALTKTKAPQRSSATLEFLYQWVSSHPHQY
jgi:hypothetical protein